MVRIYIYLGNHIHLQFTAATTIFSYIIRGTVSEHSRSIPTTSGVALVEYYNNIASTSPIYHPLDLSAPNNAVYLSSRAVHYRYIIRHGRRYTTSSAKSQGALANSSLIKAQFNGLWLYGEIRTIFEHSQSGHTPTLFVEVAWFDTLNEVPLPTNIWADL